MPRNQYLPPQERDELLRVLQSTYKVCVKAQESLNIHSDLYDASSRLLFQVDSVVEAITGDRRFLHKSPTGKAIKWGQR